MLDVHVPLDLLDEFLFKFVDGLEVEFRVDEGELDVPAGVVSPDFGGEEQAAEQDGPPGLRCEGHLRECEIV